MDQIGTQLRPAAASGFTLVLVDLQGTDFYHFSSRQHDFQLTAQITSQWTPEERRRVWIMPLNYPYEDPQQASPDLQASYRRITSPSRPGEPWTLERYLHGFKRSAQVDRVLVVAFSTPDQPRVFDVTAGHISAEGPPRP